jgi:UDP-glucose 4-epimerase
VASDDRDLNYNKYFTEGVEQIALTDDYNSHNTRRLDVAEIQELLLRLPYIQGEMKKS